MKISVVVPIYNVEPYLETCVNSIINQTYTDIDVILVNDGSTDKSGAICDYFARKDPRVKVIHTPNRGLSAARNEGIKSSIGDYIMFVDGDDFIDLNAVEDIVEIIESQRNVDIVVGKMVLYYNQRREVPENFIFDSSKIDNKSGIEVLAYFFEEIPVIMWSACRSAYRRAFLIENKLYFTEGITSEDLDLIPRIYMCANRVAVYDKPFYYYRQLRPNSITNTVDAKRFYDIISIIEKYVNLLQNSDYPLNFKRAFLMQLANVYTQYIAILDNVRESEKKDVVKEMEKIKYLLAYTRGVKPKFISVFSNLIGFELTSSVYLFAKKVRNNLLNRLNLRS